MAQLFEVPPQSPDRISKQKQRLFENAIDMDIKLIEDSLANSNIETLIDVHCHIDGKYQNMIPGWGKSMDAYSEELGFIEHFFDEKLVRKNLKIMKSKLEGLKLTYNLPNVNKNTAPVSNIELNMQNISTNTNTNNINITLSFNEARHIIEDMTALSQEDADEITKKINELEEISQDEDSTKREKWAKIKPILSFALDKGMDVVITIFSLVLQMNLK